MHGISEIPRLQGWSTIESPEIVYDRGREAVSLLQEIQQINESAVTTPRGTSGEPEGMASGRKVSSAFLTFPYTWVAIAALGGAQYGFLSWFGIDLVTLGASTGLSVLLFLVWWFVGTHSTAFVEHLYKLPQRKAGKELVDIGSLKEDLERVGSSQGVEQLDLLHKKLNAVREVLKQRLNSGELTFARYIGTAEQVYLNGVDNLREIYVALTAVSSIDARYIDERLSDLRHPDADHHQVRESEVLEERKQLLEGQLNKVSELIVLNESMMTALDNTAAKLADAKINVGHATMDADTAMSELVRLAERAKGYES